jgi:hypothetical protein
VPCYRKSNAQLRTLIIEHFGCQQVSIPAGAPHLISCNLDRIMSDLRQAGPACSACIFLFVVADQRSERVTIVFERTIEFNEELLLGILA